MKLKIQNLFIFKTQSKIYHHFNKTPNYIKYPDRTNTFDKFFLLNYEDEENIHTVGGRDIFALLGKGSSSTSNRFCISICEHEHKC